MPRPIPDDEIVADALRYLEEQSERRRRDALLDEIMADKTAVAPPMERRESEEPELDYNPNDLQDAMAMVRLLPRAKPVYPPPPPFKRPPYTEVMLTPWVQELLQSEGTKVLVKGATAVKKKTEDDINLFVRDITYPEDLINEATNRVLSKYKR